MAIAAGFGWGEVEIPVAEAADGVGDQWGDRGQIDWVNRLPAGYESVGGGGDVQGGGVDHTVSDQLVEFDEFVLVNGIVVGEDTVLDSECEPVGEAVECLDPVGDRGDGLPQCRVGQIPQ